jgi:hypothetical protein
MFRPLALVSALCLFLLQPGHQTTAPPSNAPAYTKDGSLISPANYREWIYLTSGIDMSYAAQPAGTPPPGHSTFDNVFVNPESYRAFLATGTWPDKTIMVLEARGAENPISINKRGHTQSTEVMGTEIHVKDNGTWSFYDLGANDPAAKLIPRPANCYTCHEAHGAVDTTFVQFYPTLFPLARQKHTLSEEYLKETPSPAKP